MVSCLTDRAAVKTIPFPRAEHVSFNLTVVMPAYNEEGCIEAVVREWHGGVVAGIPGARMLVVDDGSRDATGAILDRLASELPALSVVHQINAGHGAALLSAYGMCADDEYVFQVDSDGQFLPADFGKLWERRAESGFITGYREVRYDSPVRLFVTRALRLMLAALFGADCKDANIPFRLMEGHALQKLLSHVPKGVFIPNIFLSLLAARSGYDIMEIPVTHLPRVTGKVSIANLRLVRVLARCVGELASFRLGAYRNAPKKGRK